MKKINNYTDLVKSVEKLYQYVGVGAAPTNTITGTGTNGYSARFSAGGVIANGSIQDDGTNAAYGMSPSGFPGFTVNNNSSNQFILNNTTSSGTNSIYFRSIGGGSSIGVLQSNTDFVFRDNANNERWKVYISSGNFVISTGAINSITDHGEKLQVVGTGYFTGSVSGVTEAAGNSSTKFASTAFVAAAVPNSSYKTILMAGGSILTGTTANTFGVPMGDNVVASGANSVYPLATIYIDSADYPTVNGSTTKLRIRAQLYTNDVAPTGNFTIGLYPITRPATSGGAGVNIYTLGTVVTGSDGATFTTPAADGLLQANGADFALPANGHYVIGIITTSTIAVSAHVHVVASLQMRNA